MFGLSFSKVMVLVAVVAVIWFGFRWFRRWEVERRQRAQARSAPIQRPAESDGRQIQAEDMVACPRCGTYVAAHLARSCGRANCPYPLR